MTLRALPLQFLNLGGEMMYIIDQRLRAQNIPPEKAAKVRNDIIGIMLNRRFVEELFKPQELYSRSALRTVFDKLAHGSVMRLNTPSMDKLFDLMVMAVKQQVLICPQPGDLLLITLNHLDAIRYYASAPPVLAQVEATVHLFRKIYCNMSLGELADVRRALLEFVQDIHIRVSVFLKDKKQTPTGAFVINSGGPVPHGSEVSGSIRVFDGNGEVFNILRFTPGDYYSAPIPYGSLELVGPRGTLLGTNMYASPSLDEDNDANNLQARQADMYNLPTTYGQTQSYEQMKNYRSSYDIYREAADGRGREELNLLAQLIGTSSVTNKEFKLNLFQNDEEASNDQDGMILTNEFITIEGAMRGSRPELGQIMGELTLQENEAEVDKGQDLLDLMDSV
ncbi:Protein oscp1 [Halocaridina rubra]|uniref:Protein oscp1 n=1 Tax=Halocaridina rubra TaxID=373956 RepID=A0AAN8X4Z2_HALRR